MASNYGFAPMGGGAPMGGFMPQPKPNYGGAPMQGQPMSPGQGRPLLQPGGSFGGGGLPSGPNMGGPSGYGMPGGSGGSLMDALRRMQMGGGQQGGSFGSPGGPSGLGGLMGLPSAGMPPGMSALPGMSGGQTGFAHPGNAASFNPNSNPWAQSNMNAQPGMLPGGSMPPRMGPGFGMNAQPGGFGQGRMFAGGSPSFNENPQRMGGMPQGMTLQQMMQRGRGL